MRKNQKVRLLKDNSIGIITDSTFFPDFITFLKFSHEPAL